MSPRTEEFGHTAPLMFNNQPVWQPGRSCELLKATTVDDVPPSQPPLSISSIGVLRQIGPAVSI